MTDNIKSVPLTAKGMDGNKIKITTESSKLTTSAGNVTQPVYFEDGVPKATTHTLGKSVPSDAVFTDTTYSVMSGATSTTAGKSGLVPAPSAGDTTKVLHGDGSWKEAVGFDGYWEAGETVEVGDIRYLQGRDNAGYILQCIEAGVTGTTEPTFTEDDIESGSVSSATGGGSASLMIGATSSTAGRAGLVPAPDAGEQTSFLRGDGTWQVPTDTKYTHPTHTAKSSGLYKVTVDDKGHVTAATAVAKSDITALGIPAQDTTYTLPDATSSVKGGVKVGSNITVSSGTISLTKDNVTTALGYTPPQSAGGVSLSSNVTVTAGNSYTLSTLYSSSHTSASGYDSMTASNALSIGNGLASAFSPKPQASSASISGFKAYSSWISAVDTMSFTSGVAAGTYTLQNLLQKLVTMSHTHTVTRTVKVANCDCHCGDMG